MDTRLKKALSRLWAGKKPELANLGSYRIEASGFTLRLPQQLISYASEAAPASDWMDDTGLIWWPPQRFVLLSNEAVNTPEQYRHVGVWSEANTYVVFADYLDRCYDYAVCCSDGSNRGKIAIVGCCPNRLIAHDLAEFIEYAVEGSDRLHSPLGDGYKDVN